MSNSRVIIALDYDTAAQAEALLAQLEPGRCRIKIGKQLFTREGPAFVKRVVEQGFDVFLDLKYHDIPNTVANACQAAADLGVWMLNVHAQGGRRMMAAARDAIGDAADRPHLIAVTILTSIAEDELPETGLSGTAEDNVIRLAMLAQDAGLDGVVCSPKEITPLRGQVNEDFLLVTPGIRPAGSDAGDQRRITTPPDAIDMGASYLVIGRPITGAPSPMVALEAIESSLR